MRSTSRSAIRLNRARSTHSTSVISIRDIATVSLKLFDDGHYSQATFEAFKLLDKKVQDVSGIHESGHKLHDGSVQRGTSEDKVERSFHDQ